MKATKRISALLILLSGLFQTASAASGPLILVTGQASDNVVQFDLASGEWSEVVHLPKASRPRGITVSDTGEIFVGLEGGKKNIIKIAPEENAAPIVDVTDSIGRFGPGLIVFGDGCIWAAGDTERLILKINPATGEVSTPPQNKNRYNLVGLAAAGTTLYAAEYFQRSILRYDLTSEKAEAVRFISKSPHLNRPVGMTVGHQGNLFVANALVPTVVEFDATTGEFVRTLIDLGAAGKSGIKAIVYSPEVRRYYLATGSDLFEVDVNGNVLASYNSPALKNAYGVALMPARLRPAMAKLATDTNVRAPQTSNSPAEASPAILTFQPITTLKATPGALRITGKPGERYEVMATTDFATWKAIAVLDNSTGIVDFVDPDAPKFNQRFYRLEMVPSVN